MKRAFAGLMETPQNNLRIFKVLTLFYFLFFYTKNKCLNNNNISLLSAWVSLCISLL